MCRVRHNIDAEEEALWKAARKPVANELKGVVVVVVVVCTNKKLEQSLLLFC